MKIGLILQTVGAVVWVTAFATYGLAAPVGSPTGLRLTAMSISTVQRVRTQMICDTGFVDCSIIEDYCATRLKTNDYILMKSGGGYRQVPIRSCKSLGQTRGAAGHGRWGCVRGDPCCQYQMCGWYTTPGPSAVQDQVPSSVEAKRSKVDRPTVPPVGPPQPGILGTEGGLLPNVPSATGTPLGAGGRTGGSQNIR